MQILYNKGEEKRGEMVLSIDIGNSLIKFGLIDDALNPTVVKSVSSKNFRSCDEFYLIIQQLFDSSSLSDISSVISSVVPALTDSVYLAVKKLTGNNPFIIGSGTKTGFKIKIDFNNELGSDIVSNVSGAFEFFEAPTVIIDFGTATTIACVDDKNCVSGVIIVPGVGLFLESLTSNTALLSSVPIKHPDHLIGRNTAESIQSGIFYGNSSMIDGLLYKIKDQVFNGSDFNVIATGGYANQIIPFCNHPIKFVEHLTLIGSARLLFKNRNI